MNKTGQSFTLSWVFNFLSRVRQAAPTPRSRTLDIIGQGAAWRHIVQFCQVKMKRKTLGNDRRHQLIADFCVSDAAFVRQVFLCL